MKYYAAFLFVGLLMISVSILSAVVNGLTYPWIIPDWTYQLATVGGGELVLSLIFRIVNK